jgi:hypothetical protein
MNKKCRKARSREAPTDDENHDLCDKCILDIKFVSSTNREIQDVIVIAIATRNCVAKYKDQQEKEIFFFSYS